MRSQGQKKLGANFDLAIYIKKYLKKAKEEL